VINTENSKFDNKAMRTMRDIAILHIWCRLLRDGTTSVHCEDALVNNNEFVRENKKLKIGSQIEKQVLICVSCISKNS
jgi:hypothetical protein